MYNLAESQHRKRVQPDPARPLQGASRSPERIRDLLLVTLGVAAGATDATSFEGLGHVFAGVVTGNLVLLGIGGVRRDGSLALLAGCAIVGYVVGVLVAAARGCHSRCEDHRVWPAGVTVALATACLLLLAFTVAWEATGGHPGHGVQVMLVPVVGVVMGIQTTAVRRLGPFSTTYLTGTLNALLEAVAAREWSTEESRGIAIVFAAVAGAAAATLVVDHSAASLPLVPLVPLTIVVITSGRLIGAEISEPASPRDQMRKS
jgi:uncharacterized membrane protein YoaK (UPF0700 family)